jgi:hypothetical protein
MTAPNTVRGNANNAKQRRMPVIRSVQQPVPLRRNPLTEASNTRPAHIDSSGAANHSDGDCPQCNWQRAGQWRVGIAAGLAAVPCDGCGEIVEHSQ